MCILLSRVLNYRSSFLLISLTLTGLMNIRLKYYSVAFLACMVMNFPFIANADAPVKREMRSPFVATVW